MKEKLFYVSLPDKFKLNFGENCSCAVNKMLAQVADMTDKLIVDAIIKYATDNGFSNAYIIDEEFVKTALEKQIPKKPIPHKVEASKIKIGNANWCKGTTVYKCPCCDTFISPMYDYCYKCGQALDWGDGE